MTDNVRKTILACAILLLVLLVGCENPTNDDLADAPTDEPADEPDPVDRFDLDGVVGIATIGVPDSSVSRRAYGAMAGGGVRVLELLDDNGQLLSDEPAGTFERVGNDYLWLAYKWVEDPDGASILTVGSFLYRISTGEVIELPTSWIVSQVVVVGDTIVWRGTTDPMGTDGTIYATEIDTLAEAQLNNPDVLPAIDLVAVVGNTIVAETTSMADRQYFLVSTSGGTATEIGNGFDTSYYYFYAPDDTVYAARQSSGTFEIATVSSDGSSVTLTAYDSAPSGNVSMSQGDAFASSHLFLGSADYVRITFNGDSPVKDVQSTSLNSYSSSSSWQRTGDYIWWLDDTHLHAMELPSTTQIDVIPATGIIRFLSVDEVALVSIAEGVDTNTYAVNASDGSKTLLFDSDFEPLRQIVHEFP